MKGILTLLFVVRAAAAGAAETALARPWEGGQASAQLREAARADASPAVPWAKAGPVPRAGQDGFQLTDIPADRIQALIQAAKSAVLTAPDGRRFPVPWAWIQENCSRRASVVNYAFASGRTPVEVPDPLTADLARAAAEHPAFVTGQIMLSGPLQGRQDIMHPTRGKVDGTLYYWPYHVAATAKVGGRVMVVDPSVSDSPMAVADWAHSFVTSSVDCVEADTARFRETYMYYTARGSGLGTPRPPALACAYRFLPPFGAKDAADVTPSSVSEAMSTAASTLASNHDSVAAQFSMQDADIQRLSSRLTPLSEPDFCAAMKYALKWCAQYRR